MPPTHVLEDVIENYYYQEFNRINPLIIGLKESIAGRPTDGVIRFYNKNGTLKFWILQETKRDVGINSVFVRRSLLQALMYLGNVYYDVTHLDLKLFNGIFLDSSRYFIYIPKSEVDKIMVDFEELWKEHFKVAPSKAYLIKPLLNFVEALSIDNAVKCTIDNNFRLDLIINGIYNGDYHRTINAGQSNPHQKQ